MTTRNDWARVNAVFAEALELAPEQREQVLAREEAEHPGVAAVKQARGLSL